MAGDGTRTVLLVSNRRLTENVGRAEKFETRKRLIEKHGWNLEVAYVNNTVLGLVSGTARCIRKARRADVINSVSNPPQLQIAGAIAARVTGTPWMAEFRDPLVENPDVEKESAAGRARKWIEMYILRHADRIVWFDGIQIPDDYFAVNYPDIPPNRYSKLPPIGFEAELFRSVDPESFDPFTITYAGSFYDGWIEPYTFVEALGSYINETGDSDLMARFYGDWNDDYTTAVNEVGIEPNVETNPFVPHKKIVRALKGSDALLYIGGSDPRNRRNLPTKLYDYIGAQRPILALVDPSFRVAEVIRENNFGVVADPDDSEAVRDRIERLTTGDFQYDPDPEDVVAFSRENSTEAYVTVLNEVASR